MWRASGCRLFYGTFEGAEKVWSHVMATHDTARGSVECVCCAKPRTTAECPARGYFRSRASGSATPLRPSARSFSHHARARDDSCFSRRLRQARVTSRPDPAFARTMTA